MSDLRSRLIRLAAANPGLRADLIPLLKEDADPASVDQNKPESYYGLPPKGVQASRKPTGAPEKNQLKVLIDTVKNPAKGKFLGGPSAEEAEETLRSKFDYTDAEIDKLKKHGPVAIRQPEVMLYAIDAAASAHGQSKFYEMKVVPFGVDVDVVRPVMYKKKDLRKRGAGGFTLVKRWGRLTDSGSAGRVDAMDEFYDNEIDARAAMQDTKRGKMRGSGSAAYTDVSRSREYPIGLGGSGFGWGGQQACNYVPELGSLRQAVTAMNTTIASTGPSMEGLARKNSDVGRRVSALLGEVQGNLQALQAYLDDQMRHCG
jgi:hypothetical protein